MRSPMAGAGPQNGRIRRNYRSRWDGSSGVINNVGINGTNGINRKRPVRVETAVFLAGAVSVAAGRYVIACCGGADPLHNDPK